VSTLSRTAVTWLIAAFIALGVSSSYLLDPSEVDAAQATAAVDMDRQLEASLTAEVPQ